MNYHLKLSDALSREADLMQMLRNSLAEIGEGVVLDFIDVTRIDGNTALVHGVRRVDIINSEEVNDIWLRFTRGTKSSIESQFDPNDVQDQVDMVNHILNWLLLDEFSCTRFTELKAMKDKEAAKYE